LWAAPARRGKDEDRLRVYPDDSSLIEYPMPGFTALTPKKLVARLKALRRPGSLV